jgi:hypothetical protein
VIVAICAGLLLLLGIPAVLVVLLALFLLLLGML